MQAEKEAIAQQLASQTNHSTKLQGSVSIADTYLLLFDWSIVFCNLYLVFGLSQILRTSDIVGSSLQLIAGCWISRLLSLTKK